MCRFGFAIFAGIAYKWPMAIAFEHAVQDIIKAGNRLDRLQLAPATSGNYSIRLNDQEMAITVSGAHKGQLDGDQVMLADLSGRPLEDKKPSAETLLHCLIYELYPHVNAILHTHSVASTVLTRSLHDGDVIALSDYEMLKAYPGVNTHDVCVDLPVFENTQDIAEMSARAKPVLSGQKPPAFVIRCHGIYGWGVDMDEAARVIEATEMLLSCEMNIKQIQNSQNQSGGKNEPSDHLSGHAA